MHICSLRPEAGTEKSRKGKQRACDLIKYLFNFILTLTRQQSEPEMGGFVLFLVLKAQEVAWIHIIQTSRVHALLLITVQRCWFPNSD